MECPATGCTVEVPLDRFACPRHWRMLPNWLRNQVWKRWNARSAADTPHTYDQLVAAANVEWSGR